MRNFILQNQGPRRHRNPLSADFESKSQNTRAPIFDPTSCDLKLGHIWAISSGTWASLAKKEAQLCGTLNRLCRMPRQFKATALACQSMAKAVPHAEHNVPDLRVHELAGGPR